MDSSAVLASAAISMSGSSAIIATTPWRTTSNDPDGYHSFNGVAPCLYGGAGGGRFVTGKFLKPSGGTGINDVFTSLLHGMGETDPRFGDDNSGRASYGVDGLMLV